jgi:hypothetical protein
MCIRESCICVDVSVGTTTTRAKVHSLFQLNSTLLPTTEDAVQQANTAPANQPIACSRSETNDLRKAKQSHNSEADVTQQLPGDDETENKEVTYNY